MGNSINSKQSIKKLNRQQQQHNQSQSQLEEQEIDGYECFFEEFLPQDSPFSVFRCTVFKGDFMGETLQDHCCKRCAFRAALLDCLKQTLAFIAKQEQLEKESNEQLTFVEMR